MLLAVKTNFTDDSLQDEICSLQKANLKQLRLDFVHDEYKYFYLFSCLKFNETNIKTLKTFLLLIACNYYQIISQQSSSYLCYWTDKSNQIAKVKY